MHILSKRQHVFLDFCLSLKKMISLLLHFKMGSVQKTDAHFVWTVAWPKINNNELGWVDL